MKNSDVLRENARTVVVEAGVSMLTGKAKNGWIELKDLLEIRLKRN